MFGDKKKLSLDLLLGGWVWLPVKDRVLNEIIGYLYPRAILIHLPYCTLHKRWIKVATIYVSNAQCDVCTVFLMFSLQPNKLRHILKFMSWYIIQHIFVPACSVGRKTWFSRKPWLSNSKFGISGSFWPILSVPKIMFLVPENEKRNKF